MKRGTPDHWKMRELAKLLNLPTRFGIATANGIMERLWHYTAKYHPRGDIGSAPDWAIADACGWDCGKRMDRPGQDTVKIAAFIDALVTARWLDRDNACRLLVHDWSDHADTSVKKYLKDKGLSFLSPTSTESQESLPLPLPLPLPSPLPSPTPSPQFLPPLAEASQTQTAVPINGFFRSFLEPWPRCADQDGAARAWLSVEGDEHKTEAFACRDRYLASEEVSRGVVQEPKKFIFEQGKNGWSGRWPEAKGNRAPLPVWDGYR